MEKLLLIARAKAKPEKNTRNMFFKQNWWQLLLCTFVFVFLAITAILLLLTSRFLSFLNRPKIFFTVCFIVSLFVLSNCLNCVLLFFSLKNKNKNQIYLSGLTLLFIVLSICLLCIFNTLSCCVIVLAGTCVLCGLQFYETQNKIYLLVIRVLNIGLSAFELICFYIYYLFNWQQICNWNILTNFTKTSFVCFYYFTLLFCFLFDKHYNIL